MPAPSLTVALVTRHVGLSSWEYYVSFNATRWKDTSNTYIHPSDKGILISTWSVLKSILFTRRSLSPTALGNV